MIRAAGGVLWRGPRARREIALVHRPRYDDWTLPKGKLDPGEPAVVGACREVWEETGVRPIVTNRLPSVSYVSNRDRAAGRKRVEYWAMTVGQDDGFVPGHETDALAWLPIPDALRRLSYPRDVTVLSAFAALPALRPPIVLLRPTTDPAGLAERLRCYAPRQVLSADTWRCLRTLTPLAAALGPELSVEHALDGASGAAALIRRLSATTTALLCAPADVVTSTVHELTGAFGTRRARGWVVSVPTGAGRAVVEALA